VVATGFRGLQDLPAPQEQRATKAILASQDHRVQQVRSAQQAQRVRKDLLALLDHGDPKAPRHLLEIRRGPRRAEALGAA